MDAGSGKVLRQLNGLVTLQLGHLSIDLASGGEPTKKKKILKLLPVTLKILIIWIINYNLVLPYSSLDTVLIESGFALCYCLKAVFLKRLEARESILLIYKWVNQISILKLILMTSFFFVGSTCNRQRSDWESSSMEVELTK